ncbi:MAG: hypothetical protein ACTHMM_07340 [Agriterribacter sp.]
MSELIDSSLIDDISLNDLKNFISEINPVLQGVLKETIEEGSTSLPKDFRTYQQHMYIQAIQVLLNVNNFSSSRSGADYSLPNRHSYLAVGFPLLSSRLAPGQKAKISKVRYCNIRKIIR